MDKESSQPIRIGHVAKRGTKKRHLFSIWLVRAVGEKGEQIFENEGFLKRESTTSL